MNSRIVSRECIERLHVWVQSHCPCALQEPQFVPGLIVICEEEVTAAVKREQGRVREQLCKPSAQ